MKMMMMTMIICMYMYPLLCENTHTFMQCKVSILCTHVILMQ